MDDTFLIMQFSYNGAFGLLLLRGITDVENFFDDIFQKMDHFRSLEKKTFVVTKVHTLKNFKISVQLSNHSKQKI